MTDLLGFYKETGPSGIRLAQGSSEEAFAYVEASGH
jgi:hypothetical protein